MVSPEGFAPPACRLSTGCSAAELRGRKIGGGQWSRPTTVPGTVQPVSNRRRISSALTSMILPGNGPCGRNCTRTGAVLSGVSLQFHFLPQNGEPDRCCPSSPAFTVSYAGCYPANSIKSRLSGEPEPGSAGVTPRRCGWCARPDPDHGPGPHFWWGRCPGRQTPAGPARWRCGDCQDRRQS